ncbi:hypothetical protein [Brevibacillus parabrevis]|uniref:hypothetical protein n=1 Tax=Brevibacillus parabrevis TaxID=54914 RepID=UPI0028CFDB7C|nr:hypothetical protein [Brevibacillus parabrevis]
MKMNSIVIKCVLAVAGLLLLWQIGILTLGKEPEKQLSYEQFVSKVNGAMEHLSQTYKTIKPTAQHYTVYPGNPEMKWSKNKVDAIDDDLSKALTKEIFIEDGDILTKVGFYYHPWVSEKHYASVNRIDSTTGKRLGSEMTFPSVYSNSFTANGLFIQVTTFRVLPALPQHAKLSDKEMETKMITRNGENTSTLQKYILDYMDSAP